MEFLCGHPVSPGFAQGTAVLLSADDAVVVPRYRITPDKVEHEVERFQSALLRCSSDLQDLEQRVNSELGYEHSSIFSAHLALLHDKGFVDRVLGRIRRDSINAEQALQLSVGELAERIQALDNPYLRERAGDVRDIGQRVLRQLVRGEARQGARLEPRSVVVARELLPSETIDLDREHVAAIITEEGGENSHAAILARAMNIPAVTAVVGATARIAPGTQLLVDGQSGRITLTPTDLAANDFRVHTSEFANAASAAVRDECLDCVTQDGTVVALSANLNRPSETHLVADHHLSGVGLFRTEFMFIDSSEAPSLERQIEVYVNVIQALRERPLVVRTLDLGGDKLPRFLAGTHSANPSLGSRGLRFSLSHSELFETQLRALAVACNRTCAENVRVLFPMVLGEGDLQLGIDRLRAMATEVGLKRIPKVGAMIETPSALFALDRILELVDFVSIGTNDLVQFMLAVDRHAVDSAGDYSVLHPCVLRAVRSVVEACGAGGRELSVCGEAAGDPLTGCLLVGMGIRHLSMSPVRAAQVRQAIRHNRCDNLQRIAEQALRSDSANCVRQLLLSEFDISVWQH